MQREIIAQAPIDSPISYQHPKTKFWVKKKEILNQNALSLLLVFTELRLKVYSRS
jgi:hypothetical protein